MTHRSLGCALLLSTVLLAPGWLFADQQHEHEGEKPTALASQAKITIDEAIRAAREKFQVTVVEAELEKEDDKVVWEIELVTGDGKAMEVHVDATTGEVLEIEEEK